MTEGAPGTPAWLPDLAAVPDLSASRPFRGAVQPPAGGAREAAVLLLFGSHGDGADVLLIERAHGMRSHAGQPAFPGGARDPGDADLVATALREAHEETGLDPAGVRVLGNLPALYLPPSGFLVTPVLAWWERPSPVRAADPAEVASVHRVPVAELVDPARRLRARHRSGYVGPAFRVRGLLVWGFTAGLLDHVLALAGWDRPWGRALTGVDEVVEVTRPEAPAAGLPETQPAARPVRAEP